MLLFFYKHDKAKNHQRPWYMYTVSEIRPLKGVLSENSAVRRLYLKPWATCMSYGLVLEVKLSSTRDKIVVDM